LQPTYLQYVLVLSSHKRLGLAGGLVPQVYQIKCCVPINFESFPCVLRFQSISLPLLIVLLVCTEECTLRSSSLCNSPRPSARPSILLGTLFQTRAICNEPLFAISGSDGRVGTPPIKSDRPISHTFPSRLCCQGYSLCNLFILSFLYLFIYLFIHSFIHSFIHPFIDSSLVHWFIYSFIHSFIHSLMP
jgi:hypothetical protein